MLTRFPDWHSRFEAAILAAEKKAFAWGEFDCALAVCDFVLALTGTDPGAPYRSKYSTEEGAMAVIGSDLLAFVTKISGELEMLPNLPTRARRGDVVIVDNGTPTRALGTVGLDGTFALCASNQGLRRVAMKRWLRAWRVGW